MTIDNDNNDDDDDKYVDNNDLGNYIINFRHIRS